MSKSGHLCRRAALAMTALVALVCQRAAIASPKDGHEISGVYEVTNAMTTGDFVRVKLRISLTNRTDSDFSISSFVLRTVLSNRRSAEARAGISLPSRTNSAVTEEFTVSQREFRNWQKGVRPILFLRLAAPDGSHSTRTIQLAPSVGVRAAPQGGN